MERNDRISVIEDTNYPIASMGLVIKCRINRMTDVIQQLEELDGIQIVYKNISAGRLKIVEDNAH